MKSSMGNTIIIIIIRGVQYKLGCCLNSCNTQETLKVTENYKYRKHAQLALSPPNSHVISDTINSSKL